jgi:hypothetical protein
MWTKESVQEDLNFIYDNKFKIIHIKVEYCNYNKCDILIIKTKCNDCELIQTNNIKQFTKRKYTCSGCSGLIWTLEKAQEESDKIHDSKFKISDIRIKKSPLDGSKQSIVNIECTVCGLYNTVYVNDHINEECGCNSLLCRNAKSREKTIENLRNQPLKGNEEWQLYLIKFTHKITNDWFYKVGKTKNKIKVRFSGKRYNNSYNIEECKIIKCTHLQAAEQEDDFIKRYGDYQYTPKEKFEGWTECFRF